MAAGTVTVVGGSVRVQGSSGGTYCGHSLPGVPVLQGSVTVWVYDPAARVASALGGLAGVMGRGWSDVRCEGYG